MTRGKRWAMGILLSLIVIVLAICGLGTLAFIHIPRAGLMDVAGDWCSTPSKIRLTTTGDVHVLTLDASWLSDQLGMDVTTSQKYGDNAQHGTTDLIPLGGSWKMESHSRPIFLPVVPTSAHVDISGHHIDFVSHADHGQWVLAAKGGPDFTRCGLPG